MLPVPDVNISLKALAHMPQGTTIILGDRAAKEPNGFAIAKGSKFYQIPLPGIAGRYHVHLSADAGMSLSEWIRTLSRAPG